MTNHEPGWREEAEVLAALIRCDTDYANASENLAYHLTRAEQRGLERAAEALEEVIGGWRKIAADSIRMRKQDQDALDALYIGRDAIRALIAEGRGEPIKVDDMEDAIATKGRVAVPYIKDPEGRGEGVG